MMHLSGDANNRGVIHSKYCRYLTEITYKDEGSLHPFMNFHRKFIQSFLAHIWKVEIMTHFFLNEIKKDK